MNLVVEFLSSYDGLELIVVVYAVLVLLIYLLYRLSDLLD